MSASVSSGRSRRSRRKFARRPRGRRRFKQIQSVIVEAVSGGTSMAEITAQIDPNLKPERIDTYRNWQAEQKIPVVRGFFVKDVNTLELEPWDLKGVPCSMVVLDGTGGTNDAYVCEIPPGGKIKPQRHMYEEMVYVTKGYG